MADVIAAGFGRAKPNKALKDFFEEVKVGFLEDTFELRGHTWTIRTPTQDEESWADKYVQADTAMSFVSTQRIARLAVAIKSIDGNSIESMYSVPDDMSADDRKLLAQPERMRYWTYAQFMASLSTDVPPPVIRELWQKYEMLTERQDAALKKAVEAGPNP
jgi:hypothetical protein